MSWRRAASATLNRFLRTLSRMRASVLVIGPDPFFVGRSVQLAALALRHAIPTVFEFRQFVAAGAAVQLAGATASDRIAASVL